jgi:NMD protein affecting ribosome stability and mRNA decay
MPATRKYTNQTFTKRVDHEGGARRESRKPSAASICNTCRAVYADGRWVARANVIAGQKHPHWRPANETTCPACVQIKNGIVGGYLNISGNFRKAHAEEITNLLTNEANKALEDNPLSRIMTTREVGDDLLVETTTEHLAQRLGRALSRAFSGEVNYRFSHENKVARVSWHRD